MTREKFDEFIERNYLKLKKSAYYIAGDRGEDLLHDTALWQMNHLDVIDETKWKTTPDVAFCYYFKDQMRKQNCNQTKRNRKEVPFQEKRWMATDPEPELNSDIVAAITRLPKGLREIAELKMGGVSDRTIAKELGKSNVWISKEWTRAKMLLSTYLNEYKE